MIQHRTHYRVIYGDTDNMGVAYYANYLRWFEIGRTEAIRALGITYRELEESGVFLPVSEVHCKFLSSARYDDLLVIETVLDTTVKAGMKFEYAIFRDEDERLIAKGSTRHAFTDPKGKVLRPPKFLRELIKARSL